MNIELHFKTPDVVHYACEGLSEEEAEAVEHVASKYVKYGESLTVILNTETETCVIERV